MHKLLKPYIEARACHARSQPTSMSPLHDQADVTCNLPVLLLVLADIVEASLRHARCLDVHPNATPPAWLPQHTEGFQVTVFSTFSCDLNCMPITASDCHASMLCCSSATPSHADSSPAAACRVSGSSGTLSGGSRALHTIASGCVYV